MIVSPKAFSNAEIRQRYMPDRDVWVFEAPMRLDPAAIEIAKKNAAKIMRDRMNSLPPTAGVERRHNLSSALDALEHNRIVQGILGDTKDFPIFKATTRDRPDRSFFIPEVH